MMRASRRSFLKGAGVAAGAALGFPSVIPASVLGENAPSKRIALGCIGMGHHGVGVNLNMFLQEKDAHVLAVCDTYKSRAQEAGQKVAAKYGATGCKVLQDFRKVIEDPSIDAVVISTPDHWHVPVSLMALEAGKDVFCEKPTFYIDEGRALIDAVEKRKAVFQVGLEDRSLIHFHKMVEWVKNGVIGKLARIEVSLPCGIAHPKEDAVPVPDDLDWNMWLGPAPFHPYTPSRADRMHWRFISDYSNGALLDWGSHLVDTAQTAADAPGVSAVEVEGTGDIPRDRESNVPVSFDLKYRYANGVEMTVKSGDSPSGDGTSASLLFEGDRGWISRKPWSGQLKASDDKILHTRYAPGESKHWALPRREQRDFLNCVRSRKPTTYTAADMHLLHVTLHMGNMAIRLGRKLKWDTRKEEFLNDDEANVLRRGPNARDWMEGA